jgi:malonate transporter
VRPTGKLHRGKPDTTPGEKPGASPRLVFSQHAAAAQVGFRFISFVALALAERLEGAPGLVLIAVAIGVCVPLLNTAAVWSMARHGQRGILGELVRNPLIIGTVSGLVANLLGFVMPSWLEPAAMRIGNASLASWFGLDNTQTTILPIFASIPTASSAYVLAARMGYDGAYVAGLVTLSTLLGMVRLPLALGVLRQWHP